MFYKIFVLLALICATLADNMFDPNVVQPMDEKDLLDGKISEFFLPDLC
jgi:hypothetical protein